MIRYINANRIMIEDTVVCINHEKILQVTIKPNKVILTQVIGNDSVVTEVYGGEFLEVQRKLLEVAFSGAYTKVIEAINQGIKVEDNTLLGKALNLAAHQSKVLTTEDYSRPPTVEYRR